MTRSGVDIVEIAELEGRTLAGRFELSRLIGEGGYGAVFKAVQLSVERPCAVKVLSPELCTDKNTVERFKNEARMTARLTHSNTVRIIDFGRDEDKSVIFLAMELLDGRPLKDIVEQDGPMSVERTVRVVEAVAGSLQEAHQRGMVHRDIKPHNIMLVRRGNETDFVKVIDFGIAKALQNELTDKNDLTRTGMMIGTPTYMAPEQIRAGDMDGRTDQYALAMTVYHMLTGRTPFQGSTSLEVASKHLTEPPLPLSSYRPNLDVPDVFDHVLLKALEKSKEDRFEGITEFAEALRAAARGRTDQLGNLESGGRTAQAQRVAGQAAGAQNGFGTRVAQRQAGGGTPRTSEVAGADQESTQAVDPAAWSGSSQEVVGPQDTSDVPQGDWGDLGPGGSTKAVDMKGQTAGQTANVAGGQPGQGGWAPASGEGTAPGSQTSRAQGSGTQTAPGASQGGNRRLMVIVGSAAAVILLFGGALLTAVIWGGGEGGEQAATIDSADKSAPESDDPSEPKAAGGATDDSKPGGEAGKAGTRADKGADNGADDGTGGGRQAAANEPAGDPADDSADEPADEPADSPDDEPESGATGESAGGPGESPDPQADQPVDDEPEPEPQTPKLGRVNVVMMPWGDLFLGARHLGQGGRVSARLPVGKHTLTMKQNGEIKARKSIRVSAGRTTQVEMRAQ